VDRSRGNEDNWERGGGKKRENRQFQAEGGRFDGDEEGDGGKGQHTEGGKERSTSKMSLI